MRCFCSLDKHLSGTLLRFVAIGYTRSYDKEGDALDTTRARQAIFERIRKAQGRPRTVGEDERAAVAEYLQRHDIGPRPELGSDLLGRFIEQARRMSDTVERVASREDVPMAVARYLHDLNIPLQAIGWNSLQDLPWNAAGMQFSARLPVNEDKVGITGSFCAVAETGTLMLLSGPGTFASASLLPETHIAIVEANRIVGSIEDAFALARAERGELPRATNFISGPSRTADIEQTIVLGAHGPYRVHVVLVG